MRLPNILLYLSLAASILSLFFIAVTWYDIFTNSVDAMFVGLLMIALLLISLYYMFLLISTLNRLLDKETARTHSLGRAVLHFVLAVLPMLLVYLSTYR